MTYQQKPSAVTTGAIAGSHKIYSTAPGRDDLPVPFREVPLDRTAVEPPVRLYDTSGPYTDDAASIDLAAGLPRSARHGLPAAASRRRSPAPSSRKTTATPTVWSPSAPPPRRFGPGKPASR